MISPGRNNFVGIWNWDSAFHAIGMLDFDKELAKEQILGFLQFQLENGMLPDVIWESGVIEDNFSKPPVMASAAEKVFHETGDYDFLKKVYPQLVFNANFWERERMFGGLFHYDANQDKENYLKWVGYETGWDNSPRWDKEPYNCWAIDLNCYMVMTYRSLAVMAEKLGEDSKEWKIKETLLTSEIEKRLWNENLEAYTDYNFKKESFINVLSPASFMPLYVGIAPESRAEKMNQIAIDHFLPGMPTVAYDDPSYSRDYWRGPCWLNVAFFAAKGLYDYGFIDSARTIKDTILTWVENDGDYIHENYDAKTGEGLCYPEFSWSSVFVREFIKQIK